MPAPELILAGGRIRTLDETRPQATAVAIDRGRFVAVGGEELRSQAGPATELRELAGATVVPGLVDAHNHLLHTGAMLAQVQLYDCRSLDEILRLVAERVATTPTGAWVIGRGWDESLLVERRHPTRHDLDAAAPDNPVVLFRVWNKLTCNSAALRLAGIDRSTPDPPAGSLYAGSFERDGQGEPTGLFRDRAKELIERHLPTPDEDELVASIETACRAYNRVGITAVGEPGLWPHEIRAFHRARREGRLTVRTDMMMAGWGFGSPETEAGLEERFEGVGVSGGFGDELLRLEGIKLMPDGGLGDRTARMLDPYPGGSGDRGQWVVAPDELPQRIRFCHDLGFPVDCHTCGDECQQVIVRAYAAAQEASPKPWLRHRVHHAYFPTGETLELMTRYRIPALVSSPFIRNLGESYVVSVGEERAGGVMPMRTYLDRGIPLAGSSDSPITDFDPWVGMTAAATRATVAGRVLGAGERLSAEEALRSYTVGGAYATGRELSVGSIAPGKLADLVLLDRDPLAVDPAELLAVRVEATMLGGRWVFEGAP
ncbi:MAG: amidohydrolase [Gaiellales bacterium]